LLLIPYTSFLAICVPKTSGTDAIAPPPVESDNKFLPANTYEILSSCKTKTSVSLQYNFATGPKESSNIL